MSIKTKHIKIIFAVFCLAITGLAAVTVAKAAQPASEAPQNSLLKVGDKINIFVEGEEDLSGFYTINKAGMINLPLIGDILVAGKTTHEAKSLIIAKLKDGYLLKPDVMVKENPEKHSKDSIREHEATPDKAPEIKAQSTPTEKETHVQADEPPPPQDKNKASMKEIYIVGAVRYPGYYALPAEAGHILNLVALAGGYADKADTQHFEIVRLIDGKYYRKQALTGALEYHDGDIVIIGQR